MAILQALAERYPHYAWVYLYAIPVVFWGHFVLLYFLGWRAVLQAFQREIQPKYTQPFAPHDQQPPSKAAPKYDPEDGLWYAPTFDPSTGERAGKKRVDPPPGSHTPRIQQPGNTARAGMFSR